MGSNGSFEIEYNGFWDSWDVFNFREEGSLGDLMIDGLPLV